MEASGVHLRLAPLLAARKKKARGKLAGGRAADS